MPTIMHLIIRVSCTSVNSWRIVKLTNYRQCRVCMKMVAISFTFHAYISVLHLIVSRGTFVDIYKIS